MSHTRLPRWHGAGLAALLLAGSLAHCAAVGPPQARELRALGQAIEDLRGTFADRYPRGEEWARRLARIEAADLPAAEARRRFETLKAQALLANPLLDFDRLLVVKRRCKNPRDPGLPSNHECNASLRRTRWDNEIAVLSPLRPDGELTPLYRPKDGGYVGEVDLHWDAARLLFAKADKVSWKVWEMRADGSGLRQVSRMPDDVDAFDPCYLPDGRIVFGSTASYQSVPCWHGARWVSNLYAMDPDGSHVRQLCFDQDHDFHPVVRSDGQVLYHRWDYTGINHIFLRQLMAMNPDGSGQRAVYGSNSWYPNALYFPRETPGRPGRIACILSGYHGVHRMGQLVVVDTAAGSYGAAGLVRRISGRGQPIQPRVADRLVDGDWPKFLHPWPLSDKYFLVACWMGGETNWAIYLADVFDNLVLLRAEPGHALLEPVPLAPRPMPPAVAGKPTAQEEEGVVYLHDIYAGPGLEGVPRGTIKRLRVLAYHFGYRHLAGPDKVGYGGPWEVMRIVGTVPLEADGSAVFRAPAQTPLAVQALDAEGKAVQLMRSWFTLMPGEHLSCVGCHERVRDAVPTRDVEAARKPPVAIRPWHGPPRGFDFAREVQPVLDAHCLRCHDGQPGRPDLRPEHQVQGYRGRRLSKLGVRRMHPAMKAATKGFIRYTPAYEALLPYIRRVSIEDDVSLLVPGEYHADTSELVQMLRKGHGGVRLDPEAWDRLVTWIDLNAPCHGTWGDIHPFPTPAHQRRMELRRRTGGPRRDPEAVPQTPPYRPPGRPAAASDPATPAQAPGVPGWPFDAAEARRRQQALGPTERTVDLGGGVAMALVRVPAGEFVMGSAEGYPDERPRRPVAIARPLWMGKFEVTNEQFRRFDPAFSPGYYTKLHARSDDRGLPLDGPRQPAVRVSWRQAVAFCRWLSDRTGQRFDLPTEAQWEWACRAGTATPLSYGAMDADFSKWANAGDKAYANIKVVTGGLVHFDPQGRALCDARFDDGAAVTAPVGRYQPNPWGLHDLHGNAAEWTRSAYRPYPYRDDGRNQPSAEARRVVRGGSFFDRPERCRSALRLAYPPWQRVFNVAFRVVCLPDPTSPEDERR
ncbi:MAG: SUMF1/EgtB/PvdO family nonheme iron enzyme [Candidatus Brocadiia bacterium]